MSTYSGNLLEVRTIYTLKVGLLEMRHISMRVIGLEKALERLLCDTKNKDVRPMYM